MWQQNCSGGIRSAIPADEVIWTMKKVGDVMPTALKETAEVAWRQHLQGANCTSRFLEK